MDGGAIFPLTVKGPWRELPTEFYAGHCEVCASFLPEGVHEWGGFDFQSLPHGPFPFPPMGHLAHSLQCVGIGHKPVWLSHAPCHFFISHKLTNIEDGRSRWAGILPMHLDVPPPGHEETLGQ